MCSIVAGLQSGTLTSLTTKSTIADSKTFVKIQERPTNRMVQKLTKPLRGKRPRRHSDSDISSDDEESTEQEDSDYSDGEAPWDVSDDEESDEERRWRTRRRKTKQYSWKSLSLASNA